MTFISVLLIHLLMLLPVYGEVAFDVIMWKVKGKGSDKPISTYVIRPLLFIIGFTGVLYLDDKEWWRIAIVMITAFLAFFNPIMGAISLKKFGGICHLGNGPADKLLKKIIPYCAPRLFAFIWLYGLAICLYYYYEMLLSRYYY